MNRTVWLVTPTTTLAGSDYTGKTPPSALRSLSTLLSRVAIGLKRQNAGEGLVLVDEAMAARLKLGTDAAADDAAAGGWRMSKPATFTAFYGSDRPSVYLGRYEAILKRAELDPDSWPFDADEHAHSLDGLQHWHRLTGTAWQAGPSVMGLELMHRSIGTFRIRDSRTHRHHIVKVVKKDDSTPAEASVSMWTRDMWSRKPTHPFIHGYDRRRAGITAAGVAKLTPERLTRGWRKFDPHRAGWWLIPRPAWNVETMPHPCGPGGRPGERQWVTTAHLDLVAELAYQDLIAFPEVIDSFTGVARQILAPWQQLVERTYAFPPGRTYTPVASRLVRHAVKTAATRGIGMLNKADGRTSIYRPDWYAAINATKQCNGWRKAWSVGVNEDRWPLWFDDDCVYYDSRTEDAQEAAPEAFNVSDVPGGYRIQTAKVVTA